jgi:hypothetical protein
MIVVRRSTDFHLKTDTLSIHKQSTHQLEGVGFCRDLHVITASQKHRIQQLSHAQLWAGQHQWIIQIFTKSESGFAS